MLKKLLLLFFFGSLFYSQSISAEIQKVSRYSLFSGYWSVIGDFLTQPTQRSVATSSSTATSVYPKKNYIGFGISKDHIRLEYFRYLSKPRFVAAYDFLPFSIGSPYVGFVYGQEVVLGSEDSNQNILQSKGDVLVGLTFQPIPYFNFYAEYLINDHFFFFGMRFKIGHKFFY